MSAYTPTPWRARTVNECCVVAGRTTLFYGSAGNINAEADAAFIVRAVNAHADLVVALGALIGMAQRPTADYDTLEDELDALLTHGDAIDKARAVLAKVVA